tara:strand:- start:209 stop:439 length:231 start_codon:yes stop_codon:yes gene_type:complete
MDSYDALTSGAYQEGFAARFAATVRDGVRPTDIEWYGHETSETVTGIRVGQERDPKSFPHTFSRAHICKALNENGF